MTPEDIARFQDTRNLFENELTHIERASLISYFTKRQLAKCLAMDIPGLTKELYILFCKPGQQQEIISKVKSFADARLGMLH